MKLKFLKSKEKKDLIKELNEIYGIENLNYLLIETGKKKIRGFSGSLTKEEIQELARITNVETIGMYIVSTRDAEARISYDAMTLLKDIKKKFLELTDAQLKEWFQGRDLEIKSQKGAVVLKYENDIVGIGRSNGDKIFNYVPRERTTKNLFV